MHHGKGNRSSATIHHGDRKDQLPVQGIKIITLENESIIFKTAYQIILEAQGKQPFRWYLDGRLLQSPALDVQTLSPGIHKLSVQDELGNSDWLEFEVRD